MKKNAMGLIITAVFVAWTGAALAGEITGNGKSLKNPDGTLNGKSECAFSGHQDDPLEEGFKGHIAQSWGQIAKAARDFLTSIGVSPGTACNPMKAQGTEP